MGLFFNNRVTQDYLSQIQQQIGDNFTPHQPKDIFKVFNTDLNNCKVVILGEDPYPQRDIATGRAFEIAGLKSWSKNRKIKASHRNILKLLHKNKFKLQSIQGIDLVRKDKDFIISPPDELFNNWEKQGVLLLNTALTCGIGKSKSHVAYWKNFTQEVIKFIDSNTQEVKWFLWGDERV